MECWLHSPDQGPPKVDHTGPDGTVWHISVWWAEVDGRAIPIGIDIRSQLAATPVTAALIRGLPTGAVLEATRQQVVIGTRDVSATDAQRVEAGRSADVLSGQRRRQGRPPDRDDAFIRRVADLYLNAKALGGEPARKPWAHVKAALAAGGVRRVTDGQLRNWYRRAVRLSYLRRPRARDLDSGA